LAALALASCGGSGGGNGGTVDPPPPPTATTPTIAVSPVFTSLSFNQPTVLKQAPGDSSRWFVGEKGGFIRVFANNPDSSSASVFLDISGIVDAAGEGGLLGFTFHPDFPVTPEVFVSFTRGNPFRSYVSRFTSADGGQTLSLASEEIILELAQPQTNHNGGDITFGPDGLLYVGFGDGGGAGDPFENGQNTMNLHGAIVRIDVDGNPPYEIPAGNPFALNAACAQGNGAAACPEIFAWGFRNPWRFSFDTVTGRLWAGDVGQNAWEEIDLVEVGENYGWNEREGAHCFDPASGCADTFRDPHTEYGHSRGQSVTGGYVYRGADVPDLVGWYVFGDFISGSIFAVAENSTEGVSSETLLDTDLMIVAFAQDIDGEVYLLNYGAVGTIHKLEDAP
jgi:glucose/arabinose dehydrogenase